MAKYIDIVRRHEKEVNRLHAQLHETVKDRDKSQSHRDKWIKAAKEFREFRSSVNDWLKDIEKSELYDWKDGRDFTFQYLSADPIYFHSGYAKEMLVKKLKKCDFTKSESEVLRGLIINRVQSGGQREFKKFCQLIPKFQNKSFADEISLLASAKDKSVSSRAKIATRYLAKEKS